jgi:hypothetical protein
MRCYLLKNGLPPKKGGSPFRTLTGCLAFAHRRRSLSHLFDGHPLHLLSIPLGRNIEKGPA